MFYTYHYDHWLANEPQPEPAVHHPPYRRAGTPREPEPGGPKLVQCTGRGCSVLIADWYVCPHHTDLANQGPLCCDCWEQQHYRCNET
jgi:hypothetical protein